MTRRRARRSRRLTLVALSVLTALATAGARSQEEVPSSVEPQPLVDALEAFAKATGLQLIYRAALGVGVKSQGAEGGGTIEETLDQLLRGTGLTYAFVNERTVTILLREGEGPGAEQVITEQTVFGGRRGTADRKYLDREGIGSLSKDELEQLGYVVITGSHISAYAPAGSSLISLNRRDIDETGLATAQDVLRQLTQSFNGGPSEDTRRGAARNNTSGATAIDLRGIGATLVLINGRRLAPGGSEGRYVDVSGIPLTAVERIEVIPHSASAIYGADAIGGVVNFILRDGYHGFETQARYGAVTSGPTAESQIAQTLGRNWLTGNGLLSFEYYSRDALPASARAESAQSDLREWGGDNFDVIGGNPGTIMSAGQTYAIPRGQDGHSLTPADFVAGTTNLHNRNDGRDVFWDQQRYSVTGTFRQEFGEGIQIFADLLMSVRDSLVNLPELQQAIVVPATNAFYVNPSGQRGPVTVHYGFGEEFGGQRIDSKVRSASAFVGGSFDLGSNWSIAAHLGTTRATERYLYGLFINQDALTAALADSNPDTAFNPFADGAATNSSILAGIGEEASARRRNSIHSLNVASEGPLFRVAKRDIRLAVGLDLQHQTYTSFLQQGADVQWDRQLRRQVYAAYAELRVPIFEQKHRRPWLEQLEFSIAARYEDYRRFGSDATPRFGLLWEPYKNIIFRTSWAKSFKAPNLIELDESANGIQIVSQKDSSSASGFSQALLWFGDGNRDLVNETATSWTVGTEFRLPDHGLSFDLNYFDISLQGHTERPAFNVALLDDPYAIDIVTLNPSAALRAEACARSKYFGRSPDECINSPVAALIDLRPQNLARLETSGVDLRGTYTRSTAGWGTFNVDVSATYLDTYSQARFEGQPMQDLLDTPHFPIDWRVRGSVSWKKNALGFSSSLHYYDSYTDLTSRPSRRVSRWTPIDIQASYDFGHSGLSPLADAVVSINARNAFDEDPPFLNNTIGVAYDEENADLLGRFISVQMRKEW